MRRFVVKCLIMLLPVLLTLAAAEAYMRSVPNLYDYKNRYMLANRNRVETLILGNSFSLEGINPNMLRHAFNLANSSQALEHDAYLLEHYAPYQRLKTVILPLGGNLYVEQLERIPSLSHRASYYQIYMDYPKHGVLSEYGFEISNLNVCRQRIHAYRELRRQGRSLACDSLGFGPERLADKTATWQTDGLAPALEAEKVDSISRANMPYLERIADFCRARDVRLIVVVIPQWRRQAPVKAYELEAVNRAARTLVERYNIEYRNYLSDSRFTADDFFDARHLSDRGADKFTAILRHDFGIE